MITSETLIHCPNSACSSPLNQLGSKFCESCQTPLIYRYLRAVGSVAAKIPAGELVRNRYQVLSPQIWLDTRPDLLPDTPEPFSPEVIAYLQSYPQYLHIPEVYGVCRLFEDVTNEDILLLENAPIDKTGNLYPSIVEAWEQATPVRQVYWLWQMLQLWMPLQEVGAVSSLFVVDNLRVEGWRVRLQQLYLDPVRDPEADLAVPTNGNGLSPKIVDSRLAASLENQKLTQLSWQQLGECWANWFKEAHSQITLPLQEIYQQMQLGETSANAITASLNQILLQQAAQLHLRLRIVGATDMGPQAHHNEDTCYPLGSELSSSLSQLSDPLLPYLAIVCDGIGGHEGGEVASQLAVQSVKLQLQALLTEVAEQEEIMPPELVAEQIAAIIRVANNLIAARNDEQGRESRRRMATTMVLALQLPQKITTLTDTGNSHELYIAHVGDSRAYWITAKGCQLLTLDDDVATREVKLGRSLYQQALQRPDAGALTQAIGTRDADFLRPNVQRLILEEDGLLLLCSDGLSDNNLVEKYWSDYAEPVLKGQMALESAVKSLINLANQKNGHDNTSVVLSYCRISPEHPVVFNLGEINVNTSAIPNVVINPISISSAIVPIASPPQETVEEKQPVAKTQNRKPINSGAVALWVVAVLITLVAGGLLTWWIVEPTGIQQLRDRFLKREQPSLPPQ